MIRLALLLFVGTVFCQNDGKLPSFAWLEEESPFGVPLLKVGFPDGGSDEIIYLRKFNPIPLGSNERADSVDSCIYNGVLGTEKAHVTLTGCAKSNNFQIQFTSNRLSSDMFKVSNGVAAGLKMDTKGLESLSNNWNRKNKTAQMRELSPDGYILNVRAIYDDNFLDMFGADTNNAIRRVVAHAQHVFKWQSLKTKIYLNVSSDFQYVSERWSANDDLKTISMKHSKYFQINSNMYFTTRDSKANYTALGKGWIAGACDELKKYHRAMIMEYQNDDITFARSLAHELGHNLGMNHDFVNEDPNQPRVDSQGVACTGIGSIMDYAKGQEGNKRQWSSCCVEDMTAMIETYPNCLKVVDSKNPPPAELPQLPLTRNECDLNRIRPGLSGYSLLQLNGIKCTVICIDGICAPSNSSSCNNRSKTACQNICGATSC